jgi:tetratricopeptide (TPR) repeat protein
MAKDTVDTLRAKAQDALAAGDYPAARQFYQQALGARGDHPDLHYGIATVCFLLGDFDSAVHHFKEVVRIDPLRAGALVNLGAVYNRLGQHEDALAVLRRAIQLAPGKAEGFYNLALVYRQMEQIDLAVQAYREACRLNPKMYDAHYNLANIYLEKEQFNQAISHYRSALEARPNWEKAKLALEAVLDAQRAIEGSPSEMSMEAVKPAKLDPDRLIDPHVHGNPLRDLHQYIVEMDHTGRMMQELLQNKVEQALRDLSNCLLLPDNPKHNLGEQIHKFDEVLKQLQQLQAALDTKMQRSHTMAEQIAKL